MRLFLQVVLVANSLPALNDVTAMELPEIVAEAAKVGLKSQCITTSMFPFPSWIWVPTELKSLSVLDVKLFSFFLSLFLVQLFLLSVVRLLTNERKEGVMY